MTDLFQLAARKSYMKKKIRVIEEEKKINSSDSLEEIKEENTEFLNEPNTKITNKVLVTGANGFLGSHIVALLLAKNYKVKATVSPHSFQHKKYEHLYQIDPLHRDNLEIAEACLKIPGIWDNLIADCSYIIHCASPYPLKQPKNEADVVFPAVEGTLGILDAATRTEIKKIVITSSAVAIYGGHVKKMYCEDDWASPEKIMSYERSKLYAERAAWYFQKEHPNIKLTVLNPGLMLGPTLGNTDTFASADFMKKLMLNKIPATVKIQFPIVDVRDAAIAHIKALENPLTINCRYLICNKESYFLEDLIKILANQFISEGYEFPEKKISKYPFKFVSFFDKEVRLILPYIDKDIILSNERSIRDMNMKYREIDETLIDMAQDFIKKKFISSPKEKKN